MLKCFLVGSIIFGITAPPPKKEDVQQKLLGKWKVISVESKGRKLTELIDSTVTFEKDKLTIREFESVEEFSWTADTTRDPAQINLRRKEVTSDDDKTVRAIFSLEGNMLRICFATNLGPNAETERPKIMATGATSERPEKGKLLFVCEYQPK